MSVQETHISNWCNLVPTTNFNEAWINVFEAYTSLNFPFFLGLSLPIRKTGVFKGILGGGERASFPQLPHDAWRHFLSPELEAGSAAVGAGSPDGRVHTPLLSFLTGPAFPPSFLAPSSFPGSKA